MATQGSMKSQRGGPMLIGTLLLLVALPASAQASPLLSGYGGPGQGTQAILGAALSTAHLAEAAARAAEDRSPAQAPRRRSGSLNRPPPRRRAPIRRRRAALEGTARSRSGEGPPGARRAVAGATLASGALHAGGASNLPAGAYPVSERAVAQSSGALGLSTTGLLEAFLVLCGLIATLLATRRLGGDLSAARWYR